MLIRWPRLKFARFTKGVGLICSEKKLSYVIEGMLGSITKTMVLKDDDGMDMQKYCLLFLFRQKVSPLYYQNKAYKRVQAC